MCQPHDQLKLSFETYKHYIVKVSGANSSRIIDKFQDFDTWKNHNEHFNIQWVRFFSQQFLHI